MGTENGNCWELSSQISQLACQVIVLSVDTHCHWRPSSVTAKRPRLCRSVDFGRPSCSMMTFEFTTGYVMTMIHAIMTARKCNLDHACASFDRESSTATHGVTRPGTARLSRRPGRGHFVLQPFDVRSLHGRPGVVSNEGRQ